MKRLIISEDERRRILSMHESATKRQYLGEQETTTSDSTATTPDAATDKPTYTDGVVKYYVPNLSSTSLSDFMSYPDLIKFKDFMVTIGAKSNGNNVFAYPKETYDQAMNNFNSKVKSGMLPTDAIEDVPLLKSLNYFSTLLSKVNNAYLQNWRPNRKGLAVLKYDGFLNNPDVKEAMKAFPNFKEFYIKNLQSKSEQSGLTLA